MTSNTFCRRHIDVLTGVTTWVAGLEIKAKKLRSITKQIDLGIRIKKTPNRKKWGETFVVIIVAFPRGIFVLLSFLFFLLFSLLFSSFIL